jgi:hypothetical protein
MHYFVKIFGQPNHSKDTFESFCFLYVVTKIKESSHYLKNALFHSWEDIKNENTRKYVCHHYEVYLMSQIEAI